MNRISLMSLLLALSVASPGFSADLCTHVATDPDTRGFASMTDADIAADLNGTGPDGDYKTQALSTIAGRDFLAQVDVTELRAKSDMSQLMVLTLAGNPDIDPFGPAADFVVAIFGAGSATVNALAAMRYASVSPSEYYDLGLVKAGHVGGCQ